MPGLRDEHIPNYKLIQSDTGDIFISLIETNCNEKIQEFIHLSLSVESYLDDFTKHSKTNYLVKTKCKDDKFDEIETPKKKTKMVIDNDDESSDIEKPKPEISNKKENKSKKKKESGEKKGTRKRCPKGSKQNKDGDCVENELI